MHAALLQCGVGYCCPAGANARIISVCINRQASFLFKADYFWTFHTHHICPGCWHFRQQFLFYAVTCNKWHQHDGNLRVLQIWFVFIHHFCVYIMVACRSTRETLEPCSSRAHVLTVSTWATVFEPQEHIFFCLLCHKWKKTMLTIIPFMDCMLCSCAFRRTWWQTEGANS